MDNLLIEEINDIEKFRSLREPWDALLRECPDNNIFLTWEWLFTWWQHFGSNKKLRLLLAWESGKIVGIAPLMQYKYHKGIIGVEVLENIGSVVWCDYSGIILAEKHPESIHIFLDYLEKIVTGSNIIVRISHVPQDSRTLSLLREQYPSYSGSLLLYDRPVSMCPYVELPSTWEDYYNSLGRKTRESLRRKMRALQKDHVVEFTKYSGEEALKDRLQVLFGLLQKRWRTGRVVRKFTQPEVLNLYTDISHVFYQNKWLDFSFLNVDGKPASTCWGIIYNDTFHYMTLAFDPAYSEYSVGTLHMMELIKESINRGLRKFDFLQGNEAYKFRWTHAKTDNVQIIIAKRSVGGRCRLKLFQFLVKLTITGSRSLGENFQRFSEIIRLRRRN